MVNEKIKQYGISGQRYPLFKETQIDLVAQLTEVAVPKNASLCKKNQVRKANRQKRRSIDIALRLMYD